MVLTAISFLLNGEMKFLHCDGFARSSRCAGQTVAGPTWVGHIKHQQEMLCLELLPSQEPALCTRLSVSSPTLVAAEMAEYLSREWKRL